MDTEKVKKLLKDNKIESSAGLVNCIKIAIEFLKKPENVLELKKMNSLDEYCSDVIKLWAPAPTQKQMKCVKKVTKELPRSLEIISKNVKSLKIVSSKPAKKYDEFEGLFSEWKTTCDTAQKESKNKLQFANPFVTVSVKDNYDDGLKFQDNAKFGSSIEGSWGTWIEKVFRKFNPKIITIGAGRMDVAINSSCFDIKSGPRVYNAGQVDEAKAKRKRIENMAKNSKYGKFVKIKKFQITVVYGQETLADAMKDQGDLILFGKDSWGELTGDEWNAFRFFMWQIKFSKKSISSSWKKEQIMPAVNEFVNSFYDGDSDILKKIKKDPDYLEIVKSF